MKTTSPVKPIFRRKMRLSGTEAFFLFVVSIVLASGCVHLTERLEDLQRRRQLHKAGITEPKLSAQTQRLLDEVRASMYSPRALDAPGDLNQSPIRVWVIREERGVSRIYIVGHAELKCCMRVSSLVAGFEKSLPTINRWSSFGWGIFEAQKPEEVEVLTAAFQELLSIRGNSDCAGQLSIMESRNDFIVESSQDVLIQAKRVYEAARQNSRPVLAWVDFEKSHPMILPVLIEDKETHDLNMLTIPLNYDDFVMPPEMGQLMSASGIAEYIADLLERRRRFVLAAGLRDLLKRQAENPPMGVRSSKASIRLNYRDEAVVADIEVARKNTEDLLPWLERREDLVEFLVGLENAEMQPVELARIRRDVAMARKIIRVNKRALAELNRLPRLPPKIVSSSRRQEKPHVIGSSDPEGLTQIEAYTDVRALRDPDADFYKEVGRYLEFMRLEELIRETDAELVAARSLADHPPENYVPMTIDAVLRGWPLPIADEGKAEWVDAWVERHQPLIWAKMHEVLRAMGADSTGGWSSMGVFHSSDVIFRVTHDRKLIYVTPYFMISSSFFIVAEPSRRLVRYETATADQNLDFSYFEMEDAS